ncbi:hypothetical protein NST58_01800 [Paenibacillus sp. FSL R10-2796]|uniref:hypothetical protein n=1 Tax=Paenibacillus sp. FSL R10-2796 TaxID=2954663 RepID=UPI0030DB7D98
MGIWKMSQLKAPPQTNDVKELREYIKYLSNQLASMLKDLDFTLNGDVDFRNVRAKSIKADRMDVDELSAISANLGHIVAGLIESVQIFGSYIATSKDSFPRCEMSSTGNVFAAKSSADHYVAIDPNYAGTPALKWIFNGTERGGLNDVSGFMELLGIGGLVLNVSGGDLDINVTGKVNFASWDKLYNNNTDRTLQQDISEIFDRLEAGGL